MPRYAETDPTTLNDAQRAVYDAIVAGPRGQVQGPFHMLLRSPDLCRRTQALGEYLRFGSSLPPRLSEFAILVTARFWRAQFEWHIHARLAAEGGLDANVIETLRTGGDPSPLLKPDEKAVYDFAKKTHETHAVDEATFARATAELGEAGVIDLVALIGYYTLISMVLNVYEVPVPGGETPLK